MTIGIRCSEHEEECGQRQRCKQGKALHEGIRGIRTRKEDVAYSHDARNEEDEANHVEDSSDRGHKFGREKRSAINANQGQGVGDGVSSRVCVTMCDGKALGLEVEQDPRLCVGEKTTAAAEEGAFGPPPQ